MKKTLVAIILGMAMAAAIPSDARAAGKNNVNEIKVIGVEVGGIVKAVKATAEDVSSSTSATTTATGATAEGKTANAGATAQGTTAAATETNSSNSGTSKAFIDLLNAKRAEMGLNPIAWDENLAAEAQKRAQEITTNFSHDGAGNYEENIQSTYTSDINSWFEAWWNSDGHRIAMMQDYVDAGACAFVEIDGQYFITFIADGKPEVASAEEWQEELAQGLEDGTITKVNECDSEDGSTHFEVYAEGDVSICTDEEAIANAEALLSQMGLQ